VGVPAGAKGERGGRNARTLRVTIEEPGLVPMSDAERAAAVSVLTAIPAAWWMNNADEGPASTPDPSGRQT
jgi:hypothetical protein